MKMVAGKRKREVKKIWVSSNPNHEEEEEEEEGKHVYVKVKRGEGEIEKQHMHIGYKIEPNLPLRWLMIRYCSSVNLDYRTTRFFYNGARLRETDTPLQLSMLDSDVIYVFPPPVPTQGGHGRTAAHYVTLCIRFHNGKDMFLRLRYTLPILRQLKCCLQSEDVLEKHPESLCFVYNGVKLTQDHTAEQLNMEDGDVIDALDFDDSCSLSMTWWPTVTVKVQDPIGKEYVFTLNTDTPLIRLVNTYCKLEPRISPDEVRFTHKGRMLQFEKTAKEAELEDGDMVHVIPRLCGGC